MTRYRLQQKISTLNFFACELLVNRVDTFEVVLYRNQWPVNFILHSAELHIGSSIRYENTLYGNYFLNCYIVKIILISFNCFSEYSYIYGDWVYNQACRLLHDTHAISHTFIMLDDLFELVRKRRLSCTSTTAESWAKSWYQ